VAEIGRGGMGIVYEVEDTRLERRLALKVLSPELCGDAAAQRMWAEARITAKLEHPGIVPVHDAGVLPDGRVYYAMKLVRGQRLDAWLRTEPPERSRLQTFVRICEPVAFAHSRGVAHCDLKPGNIMIGSFGEVLVLDWGIAQAASGATNTAAGTPGFAPPETGSGARGDVYSLGRVLSLVAGPKPSRVLVSIVGKCTAAEPGGRYADASELADDVGRYLDGERVAAHPEGAIGAALRLAKRHRALLSLVGAYLLMRAVLLFFFSRS
jgi:serine/threonine protein kinase